MTHAGLHWACNPHTNMHTLKTGNSFHTLQLALTGRRLQTLDSSSITLSCSLCSTKCVYFAISSGCLPSGLLPAVSPALAVRFSPEPPQAQVKFVQRFDIRMLPAANISTDFHITEFYFKYQVNGCLGQKHKQNLINILWYRSTHGHCGCWLNVGMHLFP